MSLDNILLGILREPASGYDIKHAFDEVFRHFWGADSSQIYRTLNRLERDGLLESRSEPSEKGPDRRVYQATSAGCAALLAWLQQGPLFGTEKFTYLAQIFFLGEANDLELSERFFTALRDALRETLSTLEAMEAGWREDPAYPDALDAREFHQQLTLDMGISKTRALVDWAERSLERIHRRAEKKS